MEKKTKVKLLAIQLGSVIADVGANIKKAEQLLEENLASNKADFVFGHQAGIVRVLKLVQKILIMQNL